MKFYVYLPLLDGGEPQHLKHRKIFKELSIGAAKEQAWDMFGYRAKLFFYIDFFNKETFTQLL